MHVVELRTIQGPSVFHHRPVLVLTLDLEDLAETPSHRLPGLAERLLALLPGLTEHGCSRGHPGGLVERLREGTYLGHVVEHVAIELSHRAGLGVNFGKTVAAGPPGRYEVVVRFLAEEAMTHLLREAVDLVRMALEGAAPDALANRRDAALEEARRRAREEALGPTAQAIVRAAERRDLPWERVGDGLVLLGQGARLRWVASSIAHDTRAVAVDVSVDKALTKALLRRANVPVPRGVVVSTPEAAREALATLGAPLVVKPVDGHHGKGVTLGVRAPEDMDEAFEAASARGSDVVIEEQVEGRDYRVLVVGGRMVAASLRLPAQVTGDGRRTIAALVDAVNADPARGEGHAAALTRIALDEAALRDLRRRGLGPDSVPAAGEVVLVRDTANLSTGGTARDVTDQVHPGVRALCERAARVIGLDVAGVDLVAPDIALSPGALPPGGCAVIEVNAAPGLRMHHHPSEGEPRDAGAAVVELMYPAGTTGRIPIAAITGTNGKTTVTRLTAQMVAQQGVTVGMTTSTGVFVGGERVSEGDCAGPRSARAVLCDPAVEVAVLETARGGILRGGLAYDWSTVGVITNVHPDHLGQDGLESLEDLLHVKALVAERVREGGAIVLGADDPILARLPGEPRLRRLRRELVWVTMEPERPLVRRHLAGGGRACLLRDGWLVEASDGREERVVRAADVPLSFGGTAEFQVQNALFALAAARALGASREDCAAGLRAFDVRRDNAGRANLYDVDGVAVLVDYGHNPEAFRAVGRMVSRWEVARAACVASAPGDRADWLIEECGRVLGRAFSRVIVREDEDRRGRPSGVVARLLREGVQRAAPGRECQVLLEEQAAVEQALRDARPGDLVVVFYERLELVQDVLRARGARAVAAPPRRRGAA
ncbi:MAG: cyanophycin synthetase [Planctomycetes bacterium]|nr:cyanophycin synthetase [Planctomycetota bacterium]